MTTFNAGKNVHELRGVRRISLRKLASQARISPSYLSQIETGKTDPSLSVLRRIAGALEVPLFTLVLDHDAHPLMLVRKGQGRRIVFGRDGREIEIIHLDFNRRFDLTLVTMRPGGASARELGTHEGDECVYVLKGKLSIQMSRQVLDLGPGDSLFIQGSMPHRLFNKTKVPCHFVHMHSPPGFPGFRTNR